MNLKRYQDFKRRIERKKREVDREIGARERDLQRLQSEYDCATIEEAEKLLIRVREKRKRLQAEFEKRLEEAEKKWEGYL